LPADVSFEVSWPAAQQYLTTEIPAFIVLLNIG